VLRVVLLTAAIALSAGTAAARGDATRGEQLYARCAACHALAYDRVGPRHCDLLGRRAGSVPGFEYSPAMKRSTLIWTRENLSRFLANPPGVVAGTTMTYAGVENAQDRADLIAYLGKASCDRR
jgi:cytochrome c